MKNLHRSLCMSRSATNDCRVGAVGAMNAEIQVADVFVHSEIRGKGARVVARAGDRLHCGLALDPNRPKVGGETP